MMIRITFTLIFYHFYNERTFSFLYSPVDVKYALNQISYYFVFINIQKENLHVWIRIFFG